MDISDIQCKCDLLTLDNPRDNKHASHLLDGKSLPINFATWSHTDQSTGADKHLSANTHRALSRLKPIFVTLSTAVSVAYKEANNVFHPVAVKLNDGYDVQDERSFRIQTGSKIMPEYPMSGVTESLYQLRKTVGHPLHIYIYIYMVAGIVPIDISLALTWKRCQELASLVYRRRQVTN